ncbi:MAG: monovalent cation/H(+) antiporter subunit G [Rhodobacteraceae bacterium]|nr:MAG: monovalent cation/H(+) antiporter subunit G [Paracoccaceae bacterium]
MRAQIAETLLIALDAFGAALLLGGAAFVLIAALGVVRMEDVFVRMHASTKAATLGLGMIVAALLIGLEGGGPKAKAVAVILFIIATAPIAAHLIGRAVYRGMSQRERDACAPSDKPDS